MAQALKSVSEFQDQARVLTYPGQMGEESCALAGLPATVIGRTEGEETTPEDTRRAARQMAAAGADLILFAGGDGTARDLYHAVGEEVPVLGVPAGVKIHSAVYDGNSAERRRAGWPSGCSATFCECAPPRSWTSTRRPSGRVVSGPSSTDTCRSRKRTGSSRT